MIDGMVPIRGDVEYPQISVQALAKNTSPLNVQCELLIDPENVVWVEIMGAQIRGHEKKADLCLPGCWGSLATVWGLLGQGLSDPLVP